jgi:hypothetical protein
MKPRVLSDVMISSISFWLAHLTFLRSVIGQIISLHCNVKWKEAHLNVMVK